MKEVLIDVSHRPAATLVAAGRPFDAPQGRFWRADTVKMASLNGNCTHGRKKHSCGL